MQQNVGGTATACPPVATGLYLALVPPGIVVQFSSPLNQRFSTFSLQGAISRPTTLLESRTKKILTQVNWHVLFRCRTKSVTQNIRGVIERLLKAAQRMFARRMWFSEPRLRTTALNNFKIDIREYFLLLQRNSIIHPDRSCWLSNRWNTIQTSTFAAVSWFFVLNSQKIHELPVQIPFLGASFRSTESIIWLVNFVWIVALLR